MTGLALQARIESMSIPVPECGCWLWLGATSGDGYGSAWVQGKSTRAHRLSWAAYRGADPGNLFVCHHCDIRLCVNPDHLFLGTAADNNADRDRKGRTRACRRRYVLSEDDIPAILRSTDDPADIANSFGVSRKAIVAIRRGDTWSRVSGPRNPVLRKRNYDLGQTVRAGIAGAYAAGEAAATIAARFGIAPSTVSKIAKRHGVSLRQSGRHA